MSMKNSNDTIGRRTRDLPACSAVPQPTASPRAHNTIFIIIIITNTTTVGKVNMELQLDVTISFIDLQDQLNMFRANFCPSSGAQE
jgi:hypothetical protein